MDTDALLKDHGTVFAAYPTHETPKAQVMAAQEMTEVPILPADPPPIDAIRPQSRNSRSSIKKRPRRERLYSRTTIVELVSTNATSSAFPESFGLSVSSTGRWIAACSTSALYLLSVQHLPDFSDTCRAFRIRRKPIAVAVTDTGRFAVLTTAHKIDVYQCGEDQGDILRGPCKHLQTIYLNSDARTLAFSRCGEVIAAGSETGVEIKNLGAENREAEKRQITCTLADRLAFSRDGRTLLATSSAKKSRYSTYVSVSAAFEDAFIEEEIVQQPLGKVWITELLFPERVSARQAALLPSSFDNLVNNEILAFDSHADAFRIFDVTMKRFTNRVLGLPVDREWSRHDKPEEAVPAISADASSIAVSIKSKSEKEIWVYTVPVDWWEPPATSSPDSESSEVVMHTIAPKQNIKLPSRVEGAPPESITTLQWVESLDAVFDRLIALVSTINVAMPEDVVPIEAPAASGKVFLFDFVEEDHRAVSDQGDSTTVILDLSEIQLSESLTDETLDLEREVSIVRQRTQVQRNRPPPTVSPSPRGSLRRSQSSGSTSGNVPTLRDLDHTNSGRSGRSSRRRRSFSSLSSANEDSEAMGPIDEPYSQSQPRSQFSLQRAATIAANAPANRLHLRALPARPLEYRRADGQREMPHESDADNWVPPPPVYTERPDNVVSHPVPSNAVGSILPASSQRSRSSPAAQAIAPQRRSIVSPLPSLARQATGALSEHMRPRQMGTPVPANTVSRPTHFPTTATQQRAHHEAARSHSTPLNHVRQSSVPPQPPMQIPTTRPAVFPDITPAMPLGLPPNMTPPSPIAEFIRSTSGTRASPVPISPTVRDLDPIHRRSGSGESAQPSVLGSRASDSPRRIVSTELMRALPPLPGAQPSPGHSTHEYTRSDRDSIRSRRGQRPVLNRLATAGPIASPTPREYIAPEQIVHSAYTAPETPTGRRQWWRVGSSARDASSRRPESRFDQREPPRRPESRIDQYAPRVQQGGRPPPQHRATTPTPFKHQKDKEGGFKCVVM